MTPNKAIIATRFSDKKQIGNTSTRVQLDSCKGYCKRIEQDIVAIRKWEAKSAKKGNTKRLLELIAFCKEYKGKADTLVVYKVDRFARNLTEHCYLKTKIGEHGFVLRSSTEPIDDIKEGQMLEGVLAVFAEFDNAVKTERVKLSMEDVLKRGIYPWKAPTGYINQHDEKGKALISIIDETCFEDIKSIFTKFSTGNYIISSIARELNTKTIFDHKGKTLKFSPQFIEKILNNKFYAGWLVTPEWCEEREYKGEHPIMIDVKIYNKCQEIMNKGKLKGIKHLSENIEFPLRDRLYCGVCGKKMTGAKCGHKESKISIYYCHNPKCTLTKKSISKIDLEKEFLTFFATLKIKEKYLKRFEEVLLNKYEQRKSEFENETSKTAKLLQILEKKKENIMDSIDDKIYDKEDGKQRLDKVKGEISLTKLKLTDTIGEEFKLEYLIEHGKRILLTLNEFWESADYTTKLNIQRKFFPEKIIYSFPGFSNTKLSPILESLEEIANEKAEMCA